MKGSHKDWVMKGYKYVYKPDHPSAHKGGLLDGRILEHRMLAEDMIGRQLDDSESVHHIDRNRLNNDPANLVILDGRAHTQLHQLESLGIEPIMDSIQFAHEGIGIQFDASKLKKNQVVSQSHRSKRTIMLASEQMTCSKCGRPLSHKSVSSKPRTGLCPDCYKEKISSHIPSREDLIEILRGRSMEEVGREFGVSGKSVRKWADKRGIDIHGLTKPVGFTDEARKKSFTRESRKKMGESLREHWSNVVHPSSKPVEQVDETGSVIARFDSAAKASRHFGQNDGSPVTRACKDHDKTYKGFHWRYVS